MDAQNPSSPGISTIGEELRITGNVTSKGQLHVNGQVQGDIHCVALVVGENAQVEGNVVAKDVFIGGRLIGSIRALTVTLKANRTSKVTSFTSAFPLSRARILRVCRVPRTIRCRSQKLTQIHSKTAKYLRS